MTVTINGSGTLTGITAGGLPDGIIQPADLTTGAPSWGSSGNLSFNSGYGSAATAYGCRAWVNFNGTGTVAIRASGNVSSITDNGTGDYTVNFTTAMPDANYVFGFGGYLSNGSSTNAIVVRGDSTATASTFRAKITTVNLSQVDWDVLDFTFHR